MTVPLKEYRCKGCQKLLFRGWLAEGEVEVKCKSCGRLTSVQESQYNEMLCAILPCPRRIAPNAKNKE